MSSRPVQKAMKKLKYALKEIEALKKVIADAGLVEVTIIVGEEPS
jgi:hypothetical protein